MVWNRRVEDMIYHVYYMYGNKKSVEQMETLKRICMNEVNSHEGLKYTLKDDKSLEYFIIQMALDNVKW